MYNCYKKEKDGTLTLTEITEELKDAFKFNVTRAFIKVLKTDTQEEFEINEENYLKNIDFDDCRYVDGEGIIGTTVAKEISGNFINVDNSFDIENRELEYYLGAELNDEMYYLKLGTFIVQKPENDNVKDNTNFYALDYMIKFNVPFKDRLQYPCTMQQLLLDICNQAGVKCGTTNFRNSTFQVDSNQFVGGESCRDVLKAIAQMAFSWARINEENELLLDFELTDEISEEITNDEYITLEFNKKYGPVNTIILKNSQIEGENITIKDDVSISKNGSTELAISDNPFAYSQSKRSQLISAGVNLYGFNYTPLVVKTIGFPYLNCKNKIRIKNMQGEYFDTYIFNNKISYGGTITDIKESIAMTETETKYQYTGTLKASLKRTEIIVDKQNQKIESVINNVTEQNNKISQVTQTVDELNSKISDIADITTSQESINGKVILEKINQSEPIYVKIYPRAENISYLYPHSNLYPSETLYLKTRTLRFTNTTNNTYVDYELPDNLLYYDAENYDEFILDYDAQSCVINKKVGYNADGTTYLLENPTTIEYEYPKIELEDGDYIVSLLGYTDAYLFVRLMAQNIYTTQFATRAEVNSEISQKADEITATVSKSYATKGELNTAKSEIKQTTDSITSTVSKKVGNDEIISKINQSAEEIQINADKINIDGKAAKFKTNISETLGPYTNSDTDRVKKIIQGQISATSADYQKYDIDKDGEINSSDLIKIQRAIAYSNGYINITGTFSIDPYSNSKAISVYDTNKNRYSAMIGILSSMIYNLSIKNQIEFHDEDGYETFINNGFINHMDKDLNYAWSLGNTGFGEYGKGQSLFLITPNGHINISASGGTDETETSIFVTTQGSQTIIYSTGITTPNVTQTSLEESKKNFEKLENGLDIVKNTDIYKYNLKSQEDTDKKHIGFVIGDNYNYSQEITSENNDGVDTYSMISVAYKAIQELAEQNEQLQKEIQELKGEKNSEKD